MTTTIDPWSSEAGEPLTGSSAQNSCWRYVTAAEMEKMTKATEQGKRSLAVKKAAEKAARARKATAEKSDAPLPWGAELGALLAKGAKEAKEERIKQIEESNARWLKQQKGGEPLISDKEGGLLVLGAAACCVLAAPLTAAGAAFGLLCFFGHYSD